MDYKKLSLGLGAFSIGLGVAELFASRRIARMLGTQGHEGLIKGFGAREVVAGVGILAQPAASLTIWNRVAGDAMDLAALGFAARKSPRSKTVWGSLAFVAGATAIDFLVARGLDKQTGKTFPIRESASIKPDKPAKGKRAKRSMATTIEPEHTAHALAPAVG